MDTEKLRKSLTGVLAVAAAAAVIVCSGYVQQNSGKSIGGSGAQHYGQGTYISDTETPLGSKAKKKTKTKKTKAAAAVQPVQVSDYDVSIMAQCDQQRIAVGQKALTVDAALCADAMIRAKEISVNWSHTRPDGTQWWTVDEKNMNGENLAFGYDTSAELVLAWVNSPHHYANMIEPAFTRQGCGTYTDADGVKWTAIEYGQ